VAAMVGFDPEGEADEVAEEMKEIAESARCGEVTRAVRNARIGGREVTEGAYIGLLDGELRVVEENVENAAVGLAEEILAEGADLLTVLRGADLGEDEMERIAARIGEVSGETEVDVRDGGQPMYHLQMVAE
jgi:uncharacterized protein